MRDADVDAVARAAAGDVAAAQDVRRALDAAGGDRDALALVLDPLACAAAGGSEAALEELLDAVDRLRLARPAVRRLVLDEGAVEDVCQDVLIAVAEGVHRFRGDARFTTWLHGLARNKAVDHLRRRREEPTDELPDQGDAARISSLVATRLDLDDILAGLPRMYAEPVLLRDVEQLHYAAIATRLGLKPATTRSRVARGRALVAARLRRAGMA